MVRGGFESELVVEVVDLEDCWILVGCSRETPFTSCHLLDFSFTIDLRLWEFPSEKDLSGYCHGRGENGAKGTCNSVLRHSKDAKSRKNESFWYTKFPLLEILGKLWKNLLILCVLNRFWSYLRSFFKEHLVWNQS